MIRAVGLREIAKQNSKQKQKKVVSVTASHFFKKRSRGCRWHIPLLPLKLKLLWEESAENLISALLNSKWEEENELFSFPLLLRYTTTTTNAIAKLFSPFFFFIPFPLENICIRISMYICSYSSWRRLLYIQENSTKISNWKMAHSYFFFIFRGKTAEQLQFPNFDNMQVAWWIFLRGKIK